MTKDSLAKFDMVMDYKTRRLNQVVDVLDWKALTKSLMLERAGTSEPDATRFSGAHYRGASERPPDGDPQALD